MENRLFGRALFKTNNISTLTIDHLTTTDKQAIFFIDSSVNDYQQLLGSIDHSAEVVILNKTHNGIQQISAALAGQHAIDSLHVISHGAAGELFLGDMRLDSQSIDQYADDWAVIKAALSNNADIMLYGCNVAADAKGQAFIQSLSLATGADIAASVNKTGASELGGDWILEHRTGKIKTTPICCESWKGTLGTNGLVIDAATPASMSMRTPTQVIYTDAVTLWGNRVNLVGTISNSDPGVSVVFSTIPISSGGYVPGVKVYNPNASQNSVSITWTIENSYGSVLNGSPDITISDIDGITTATGPIIEAVSVASAGLVGVTTNTPTDINISTVASVTTATGTQNESGLPQSAVTFDWANVDSWTTTFTTTNSQYASIDPLNPPYREFALDGSGTYSYSNPQPVFQNNPPWAHYDTIKLFNNVSVNGNFLTGPSPLAGDVEDGAAFTGTNIHLRDATIDGSGNQIVTVPGGVMTLHPDGAYTFVPKPDYVGGVNIDYSSVDSTGLTSWAGLYFSVAAPLAPGNTAAPVATYDQYDVLENLGDGLYAPYKGDVSINDSDADGDPLAYSLTFTMPAEGNVVLNSNGTFEFTPTPGFLGWTHFDYQVTDGRNGFDTTTAWIYVSPDTVDAVDDSYSTLLGTNVSGYVGDNDTDNVQSKTLTYALVPGTAPDPATQGSLNFLSNGTFEFTPASNYAGHVNFRYSLTDTEGHTDTALVDINVGYVSTFVHAQDDGVYNTPYNTPYVSALVPSPSGLGQIGEIAANDTHNGDNPLVYSVIAQPTDTAGNVQGSVTMSANGAFTYTPPAGFSGTVTFPYSAAASSDGQSTAIVTLVVGANPNPNTAPVAVADTRITGVNTPVSGNVIGGADHLGAGPGDQADSDADK